MRIGLVSLDQKWENKEFNQERCRYFTRRVEQDFEGVELIVYPEMTLTGFSVHNPSLAEFPYDSPTMNFFQNLAKTTGISQLGGMIIKNDSGELYNRCFFIDQSGVVRGKYDKMHTFSFAGESDKFCRGDALCSIKRKKARLGLSICFDLRFSNLYAHYGESCEVVVNIANWPAARGSHWLTLLRARAIENQNFMVGVNRTGEDGAGIVYDSTSVIYDPLGEKCLPLYEDGELAIYDLDISLVSQTRTQFPFINDRREIS